MRLRQLDANGPAADDDQVFGQPVGVKNCFVGFIARLFEARDRRHEGRRPGGDDEPPGGDRGVAGLYFLRPREPGLFLDDLDAHSFVAGHGIVGFDGGDDAVDMAENAFRVDGRVRLADAETCRPAVRLGRVPGRQQGLGRHAPVVEAIAAHLGFFDQRHAGPHLRRAGGHAQAPGAGADDADVDGNVFCHGPVILVRSSSRRLKSLVEDGNQRQYRQRHQGAEDLGLEDNTEVGCAATVEHGAEPVADAAKDGASRNDAEEGADDVAESATEEHESLFAESRYPSAGTCGTCHPKQYEAWSVSQHSYSQLSPAYLSLNNKINELANGSNGDFCLRCHNAMGSNLGEDSFSSNLTRHPTSREGITCVVCHRLNKSYNKVSGRLALVEGGLTEVVFGPMGNAEMERVLDNTHEYRVVTDPKEAGRQVHKRVEQFANISEPMFCGTCHDVTLFNGFRLEEAFSEYRTSPAAARGETCQDCHMGKVQGVASGYDFGPAAVVGGVETMPRKLTNHFFAGPDYSLIHPGIFPHNSVAQAAATMEEWLQFDVDAGWGTDEFEDTVTDDGQFPEAWQSVDDRYDARDIIDYQLERLAWATEQRLEVLRNGYILGDIVTKRADAGGIEFDVQVRNGTDGHNVPTGFTGERLVWLEVTVSDNDGNVLFVSGDRDPNGDLRDGHSAYVHAGEVEMDPFLLSLQSIFVTQNVRGGEIEHVIPIPYPVTALPRVLPSAVSLVFTGEPATECVHKMGIEPHGERWGHYLVESEALTLHAMMMTSIPYFILMKPNTLGQASRISGVSPSDISVLLVHLRDSRHKRRSF